MGSWWWAASSRECAHLCIMFCAEFFGEISNHPGDSAPYSPDWVSCNFWFFPKLKSSLKGKRFQTINDIQENPTGQLMVIRRTVWGPKVPALKGTEVSLSYVQCFLYLVPSSINVSFIAHEWIFSGQTLYIHIYIVSYVSNIKPSSQGIKLLENSNIFLIICFM